MVIFGAVALFPLNFLNIFEWRVGGIGFHPYYVFFSVLIVGVFCLSLPFSRFDKGDILFWGCLLVSLGANLMFSVDPKLGIKSFSSFIIRGIVPALILQNIVDEKNIDRILKVMVLIVIIACVNSLVAEIFDMDFLFGRYFHQLNPAYAIKLGGRIGGPAGHPLPYSVFLSMFLAVIPFIKVREWLKISGIMTIIVTLLLAQSRVSIILIGFSFLTLAIWFAQIKKIRAGLTFPVILSALALFLAVVYLVVGGHFRHSVIHDTHRFLAYKFAWNVAKAHPLFGTGFGTCPVIYEQFVHPGMHPYIKTTDNQYLRMWIETGSVGVLFFMGFLVLFARRVKTIFLNKGLWGPQTGVATGLGCAFIGFAFFEGFLHLTTQFLFWSFFGMLLGLAKNLEPSNNPSEKLN